MKQFDVEIKKSAQAAESLPAGAYVAEIKKAEVVNYDWGEVLLLSIDIAEGEHKGHFANEYRSNPYDNKKWKGTYRLNIPQPDNKYYDSQKKTFGNFIFCLQASNPGYSWDWDEGKLKGKKIGVLYREYEWDYEGKQGVSTECCRVLTVEDVNNGNFKIPAMRKLKNSSSGNSSSSDNSSIGDLSEFEELTTSDDGLPF